MINEQHITNTLEQVGTNLTMTEAEHARVKNVLTNYMEEHPFGLPYPTLVSPYSSTTLWLGRIAVVGAVALVVTGSTIIAAANQALPGDTLYGFKIGVNEEIQSFLKPTPAARLVFETQRTEERLHETQVLNQEAQQAIQKNIQKHSEEISRQAKELATLDPITYQEVALVAQNSLARKAEETKNIAKESIGESPAHDALIVLATHMVTEQATATLAMSDIFIDPSTNLIADALQQDKNNTEETVPELSLGTGTLSHDPQYLAYLIHDVEARVYDTTKTTPSSAQEELILTKTTSTQSEVIESPVQTKISSQNKPDIDPLVLSTLVTEARLIYTKNLELSLLETTTEDSNFKNSTLFIDKITEIYKLLGIAIPEPISVISHNKELTIPYKPTSSSPTKDETKKSDTGVKKTL